MLTHAYVCVCNLTFTLYIQCILDEEEEPISRKNSTKSRHQGSGFTKLHAPTGKILPRLGNVCGDGDGAERDETLRQMYRIGPQRVRGWKYV
jgi:hypothetical protein